MSFYLVLVSQLDAPIYESTFTSSKPNAAATIQSGSTFPVWSSLTSSSPATPTANRSLVPSPRPASAQAITTTTTPTDLGSRAMLGSKPGSGINGSSDKHVLQMIAHASLDVVEEITVGTGSLYLKCIDKFNEWNVSAFIMPCCKAILLHDMRADEPIKAFLQDVWEAYTKILLNPFNNATGPIRSPAFDARIRASAKRNL